MKTSARNQFEGEIRAIRDGAVHDEITITLAPDREVVATITSESRRGLGLAVGMRVVALVKASSVLVGLPAPGLRLSARNQLLGTVARVVDGPVHSEIVIDLPGAGVVAATITHESADTLGLKAGQPAVAIFKASSVIVAVP